MPGSDTDSVDTGMGDMLEVSAIIVSKFNVNESIS